MNQEQLQVWSKLKSMSMIRRAQVLANPLPYLIEMEREVVRLRKGITDAYEKLAGIDDFTINQNDPRVVPVDFTAVMYERNRRAALTLNQLLETRGDDNGS